MKENSLKHFSNVDCEYFPCHPEIEDQNCMFCYCPLYALKACGGDYTLTEAGLKDCSRCTITHEDGGWDFVVERLSRNVPKFDFPHNRDKD